jgi:hypothetical protein
VNEQADIPEFGNQDAAAASDPSVPVNHKFLLPLPAPRPYTRSPVIPNVVKAAPHTLSMDAAPNTDRFLLLRQLLRYPQLQTDELDIVRFDREQYRDWKEQQRKQELDYLQDDMRTEEEKAEVSSTIHVICPHQHIICMMSAHVCFVLIVSWPVVRKQHFKQNSCKNLRIRLTRRKRGYSEKCMTALSRMLKR